MGVFLAIASNIWAFKIDFLVVLSQTGTLELKDYSNIYTFKICKYNFLVNLCNSSKIATLKPKACQHRSIIDMFVISERCWRLFANTNLCSCLFKKPNTKNLHKKLLTKLLGLSKHSLWEPINVKLLKSSDNTSRELSSKNVLDF